MAQFLVSFLILILAATVYAEPQAETPSSLANLSYQHYAIEGEENLTTPVLTIGMGNYYLETRFNYEDRDAVSVWLARPFATGEIWETELTPMLGVVSGSIHGMAPGFKADVTWKRLNLYSEMEYVFNFDTRDENFFYSWSELTAEIFPGMALGIVGNRTRLYDTSVEIDRGPIIRLEIAPLSIYFAGLNLGDDAVLISGIETLF